MGLSKERLNLSPKDFYKTNPSQSEAEEFWAQKDREWEGYRPSVPFETPITDEEWELLNVDLSGGGSEGE